MNYSITNCSTCNRKYLPSSRHKNCPKCRAEARKKNCKECQAPVWENSTVCIKCHNASGDKSPSWKGGRTYHKAGYVMIKVAGHPKNNGYLFEHILVMENYLGRKLYPGENIHHINGVKDDNRLENLELWIRPQPTGIRAKDAVIWAKEILLRYGDI
jgi:hypothetical protein